MFAKGNFHGLRVDLLFYEHPFFGRITREYATELSYTVGQLRTATVEGLILLKFFALPSLYRQFDLDRAAIYEADLVQLVSRTPREDSFFLNVLSEYLPGSDRREVSVILGEIRQKIARLRRGSSSSS